MVIGVANLLLVPTFGPMMGIITLVGLLMAGINGVSAARLEQHAMAKAKEHDRPVA